MKNLFTTIFATAALLVANNAWADEDLTPTILTNCNFENNEILFSNTSRVSIGNVEDATTSSHVLQFTSAGNSTNGYTLSTYNFAEAIGTNAAAVKIEFDYNLSKGNASYFRYITIGDGSARDGFARYTYSNAGGVFAFGLARISSQNYFSINGEKNNLENSESNALGTWAHADIYIDLIEKKVSYNISNIEKTETCYTGSNIDFYGTGTYVNQIDYFDCANNVSSYIDNLIITKYTNESAQYANYSVKYVCGENEIKTSASRSGVVGDVISLLTSDKEPFFNSDNSKKYIYESDDSENKAIESDGSSVVTVNFREAETYNYAVKTSFDEVISSGSTFEGETVIVPFSKFLVNEGTLYTAAAINKEYRTSFVPTENDFTQVVTYSEVDLGSSTIAYISEAEDIEGLTLSAGTNVAVRSSKAGAAYAAEDAVITTLEAGKYKIFAIAYFQSSEGGSITIATGENNFVISSTGVSQQHEVSSEEFVLTEATEVKLLSEGMGNTKSLDALYIVKIPATTYTIKYVNELGSQLDCIDNIVTEINIGEEFTATEAQMAEIVDDESELTYIYKSGNETKTAVADAAENVITLVYELKVEPQDPGSVTSVGSVKANAADGDIYTLGGVKVVNPTPGLYIQNGKLVRMK